MVTSSIAIILCMTTVVIAYFGRTAEKDYIKGLFSNLTIYLLTVDIALARSFSETEIGSGVVTDLIGYIFVIFLLISFFISVLMIVQYLLLLLKYLKERKKGFGGKDMVSNNEK
jgi:hypothetical protein